MNVVFCSSEVFPFAKTGGLGDVCGSLPVALEKIGIQVTIVMPGYGCVSQAGIPVKSVSEKVSRAQIGNNIQVYFIEHGPYFDRKGLYVDDKGDYPDNLERFSYYCQQVLPLLKTIDVRPDIIHCHDWQTALIPVYVKERYAQDPFYAQTKTIMTIHNIAFQGVFQKDQYPQLGLESPFAEQSLEFYDRMNLLKAGVIYGDRVTTVSPRYAKEIQTKPLGCGLDHVLNDRYDGVIGILNGLDHDIWNPRTDRFIAAQYSADDFIDAKLKNKSQLQKELHFDVREEVPLCGFVGRLSHQKGIDLIIDALEALVSMDVQIVFLGKGERHYQEKLEQAADLYPGRIAVCSDFNEPLGHQIYAGSDLFLMPSQFEPCGLSQMISLAYGTIPVVFKTGGLADTVKQFSSVRKEGNGFVFKDYSSASFLKAMKKAIKVFKNEKDLHNIRGNAFQCDFSWEKSARIYQEIYHTIEKQ
ncbi:MAG: glycogen synthase GlgA [Candidatus Omnitrophica bacterium]|nr:glycogen synthase GlgA [Candidatus Omnitrophota bacterium]